MKKKIYCFINSGKGSAWIVVVALCEDGYCLAEHCSSNEGWAKHDIGIGSDWKHEHYREHCPEGYELVWIEDASNSPELNAACAKNKEL